MGYFSQILSALLVFLCAAGIACQNEPNLNESATTKPHVTAHDVFQSREVGVNSNDSFESIDAAADQTTVDSASIDAAVGFDAMPWQPSGEPDLILNTDNLASDIWFDEIFVTPESCAYLEGCVDGLGLRRIMRFSVATGNVGASDYILGDPALLGSQVEFSPCHNHYHYTDYANYELRLGTDVIRYGHKQSFCLMDIRPMDGVDRDFVRERARYNCRYQGISSGWEDVYGSELDCQWVDITELAPGSYDLAVQINPHRVIKESRFDNNDGTVQVTIPLLDAEQPCPADTPSGLKRYCGWEKRAEQPCVPGSLLRVGGGGCYGLGSCSGMPVMRLCDAASASCSSGTSLAEAESGCDDSRCPYAETICPPSGSVGVWVNAAEADNDRVIIEAQSVSPRLDTSCEGDRPRGLSRLCGWSAEPTQFTCTPGETYSVGCKITAPNCAGSLVCVGDPMLRVCETTDRCTQYDAIAEADDACGSRCPQVSFTCPTVGRVSVIRGAFDADQDFSCELSFVLQ